MGRAVRGGAGVIGRALCRPKLPSERKPCQRRTGGRRSYSLIEALYVYQVIAPNIRSTLHQQSAGPSGRSGAGTAGLRPSIPCLG